MKKLKISTILMSLIFSTAIISSTTIAKAADSNTLYYTHQGGQDRYETSRKLVHRNIESGFKNVVLVSGSNYPDALSAAPLAKSYDAPIMLLPVDQFNQSYLDEDTKDILRKHGVNKAFIIGGKGVVSSTVDRNLSDMKISTTRISGQDRYETSMKIAEKLGSPLEVFVTTGEDYKDAMSASAIAAKKVAPIILTPPSQTISSTLKDYITKNNVTKTYVVGGNDLVNEKELIALPGSVRIPGNNPYERNINLIKRFNDEFKFSEVYIASGEGFADGLSGSVIAARNSSPIILVKNPIPEEAKTLINSKRGDIHHITVLGGEGSVSNTALEQIGNLKEQPYLNEKIQPYYEAFDYNNRDFYRKNLFTYGSTTYYGFQMANSYGSNRNPYMSFDLQEKYKSLSGKVGIHGINTEGTLKVYGDDKLINQYNVKSIDNLTSIDIDVEDVSTLKFVFVLTKGGNEQKGSFTGLVFVDTKIK